MGWWPEAVAADSGRVLAGGEPAGQLGEECVRSFCDEVRVGRSFPGLRGRPADHGRARDLPELSLLIDATTPVSITYPTSLLKLHALNARPKSRGRH